MILGVRRGLLMALLGLTAPLLAACDTDPVVSLPTWQLEDSDGVRGEVHLPARFDDHLAAHVSSYRLTTTASLAPAWHGRALTLAIPHFLALATLRVDGIVAERLHQDDGELYRGPGPLVWRIPAELTADGELQLALEVEHTWAVSGWLRTVPRLSTHPFGDHATRFVRTFNAWTSATGLGTLLAISFTYLVLFLTDRERTSYGWLGLMTASATIYLLFLLGIAQRLFGVYEAAAVGISLSVAGTGAVYHLHAHFGLGRASRLWPLLPLIHVVLAVTASDPFLAPSAHIPIIILSLAVFVTYVIACSARLMVQKPRPAGALPQLVSWTCIGLGAAADGAVWLGVPDLLGGLRLGGVALASFSLVMFVALCAEHLRSLRRADRLNTELASRMQLIADGKREIEELNAELRRQIAERSRQLSEALAKLAQPAAAVELAAGDVIDDRYRILDQLGAGAMGTVYLSERMLDERRLALKVLTRTVDARHMARFAREAQLACEVTHPNVVAVVDVGFSSSGFMYLVMEHVDGPSLKDCGDRFGDVGWALDVIRELADGLAAIHAAGIVHRDLKPANVLVSSADPVQVKISDFGISGLMSEAGALSPAMTAATGVARPARDPGEQAAAGEETGEVQPPGARSGSVPDPEPATGTLALPLAGATVSTVAPTTVPARGKRGLTSGPGNASPQLTQTGFLMGTPVYMAPELADGARDARASADIFSLGVMAYELLVGRRPFDLPPCLARVHGQPMVPARSLKVVCPALPTGLAELIDDALSFEVTRRPTAARLAGALARRTDGARTADETTR